MSSSSSLLTSSLALLSVLGVVSAAASSTFNAANIDHDDPEGLPPSWRQLKQHSESGMRVMADPPSGGGAADHGWNYRRYDATNGPYAWKTAASGSTNCGGQRQSPIDIVTSTRVSISASTPVTYDSALPSISTDFKTHKNVSITNNGHTVQLTFDPAASTYSSFTAGALGTDVYKLAQFHFHQISEHTIDGKYNPAELHLVGMNTNPAHAADSLELSVIGIMLQEADPTTNPQDNSVIASIIEVIESAGLNKVGISSYVTKEFDMKALITPLQTSPHYWTYLGSLTAPNCRESVTWHVVQTPLLLPGKQLDKLREVLGNNEESGQFNYRNTQPLNGRVVRTNKLADPAVIKTGAAASSYVFDRLTMAIAVVAGVFFRLA